jgi:dTDP-4-amino-4,6-dideoxygalactose transaminase
MITFRDQEAYQRAWAYRDHGRSWDKAHDATVSAARSQFKWLNDSFGTNARMTEIQGAAGLNAFEQLRAWTAQRALNAQVLIDAIDGLEGIDAVVIPAEFEKGCSQAFYRLYAQIDTSKLMDGWTRDRIIDAINCEGAPVQYGSCALIGDEEAFANARLDVNQDLLGARSAHESSIAFFVHPSAGFADMRDIATALRKVMEAATSRLWSPTCL